MLIDTHSHLNFDAFNSDLEDVLARAKEARVGKIIIPGAKLDSSKRAVEIAGKYDQCFVAIGIHPHHLDELTIRGETEIRTTLTTLLTKKVVAIGEIGMDAHVYRGYPPITEELLLQQEHLLTLQLTLAYENTLPVILHCRDIQDRFITILKKFKESHPDLKGVWHCFDGEQNHLQAALSMGLYIGFDGNVTYPANEHLRSLVLAAPVDRLLLETDAPYLTPIPYRSQRNEPAHLIETARFIAKIRGMDSEKIARITTENALRLFSLT
jgi:TatD DNase family protein